MLRSVFYLGVGCCTLMLACGASAPDGASDSGNGPVGESAESLRSHGQGNAAQPSTPASSPPRSGNGSSSNSGATGSPPSSGNGSSGSSHGPANPQPTGPGCSDPSKPVCPQACPIIDICRVCPDGSCGVPHVACNADGSCGNVTFDCAVYEPCGGKQDGDNCTLCDPKDPDCVEDASLKTCHGGVCGASASTCPEQCAVIDICQVCPDNSCGKPVISCNPDGSCGNVTFTCN
jgi:hypothetical protein